MTTTPRPQHYSGLVAPARAWLAAEVQRRKGKLLFICRDVAAAERFYLEAKAFAGNDVLYFPAWDSLPMEQVSPSLDISAQRLGVLSALQTLPQFLLVAPAQALSQRVLSPQQLNSTSFVIRLGEHAEVTALAAKLEACGYNESTLVEESGDFSAKGQVVDFFPALTGKPIRIEVQNGRVSRIVYFDSETQRSESSIEQVEIRAVRERVPWQQFGKAALLSAIDKLKARGKELETPPREIVRFISALRSTTAIPGIELIDAICNDDLTSPLRYLPRETQILIDDHIALETSIDKFWDTLGEREAKLREEHFLLPARERLYESAEDVLARLKQFPLHILDHLSLEDPEETGGTTRKIRSRLNTLIRTGLQTKIGSGEGFQPLRDFLDAHRRDGFQIAFVVGTDHRLQRIEKMLLDLGTEARRWTGSLIDWKLTSRPYPVVTAVGQIESGFELTDDKVIVVSEQELFGDRSQRTAKKSKITLKKILSSLSQLSAGDYLVHTDFGIGRYRGLKHIEVSGNEADFLHIDYADSTLYLPIHNVGKVSKFQAPEGQEPKLDRLKNSKWPEKKTKVRSAVETLAGDLLRLYAARTVAKGWRFDLHGAEDERFAETFPYDETPDQLKAIEETLSDMASEKPMDRLVCGDVGFGKTEVAIRAAFKCLQHARQVAVLVPTTILAEQHRLSFESRLRPEGYQVGAVSRFASPLQNKKTLERLASGELDVIVGTHRLLSKDVQFGDLGLVIVDEEHRFGVKHKERLKEMKKQVEVLTLTATPIPRTLHMSLLGIRDISVITTAPVDRRLVRTYIARHDETLIRDAIERELGRGGQVFFIHNRVQSIEETAAEIRRLVPHARVGFGHGQMNEHTLEKIMQQFLQHEIDVLVSTTIVESGIDIPNANTIIIDRADTYGLAQLYQLRGRVGRSKRQAFAYLLIPKQGNPGPDARARLKALQALDDLGVGFNLAVRDLEIRGAGNLLGKEQSGHVMSVGFELYTRILKEAILNLKGEEVDFKETLEPDIKLPLKAFIPEDYIPEVSERLLMYQRFSGCESPLETDELLIELEDRYGTVPEEARELASLMRLRSQLRAWGIVQLELTGERLLVTFHPRSSLNVDRLLSLVRSRPDTLKVSKNNSLAIQLGTLAPDELLSTIDSELSAIVAEIRNERKAA